MGRCAGKPGILLLMLLALALVISSCMRPSARHAHLKPPDVTPTPTPTTTPGFPAVGVPGFGIASGGTLTATGTGISMRSTVRQVGRPIVQSGTGMTLLGGVQGANYGR